MKKRVAFTFGVLLIAAASWSAGKERAWQTGTWSKVQVVRPKFVLGISRNPAAGGGSSRLPPAMTEVRTYVIETDEMRFELKETAPADFRRIDAVVGQPVTFALEKNTVYIREAEGVEHKLTVTKKRPVTE